MDSLYNNRTQPYDAVNQGLPPTEHPQVQNIKKIFQGLLQFFHFVANKRNITHEQYFRIQSELIR